MKSPGDLLKILKVGQKQRKVGATKMNEGSSRSHSILTITIESSEKMKDKEGNETVHYKVGKLNMVDLAGSERQKKTEASGARLEEANSINWSLTVLGNWLGLDETREGIGTSCTMSTVPTHSFSTIDSCFCFPFASIKALVEPNSKHIPYRDSKLTRSDPINNVCPMRVWAQTS